MTEFLCNTEIVFHDFVCVRSMISIFFPQCRREPEESHLGPADRSSGC